MDLIGGGEFGIIREVWRIKLNYEDRTSSTPESVAAKFAVRDPHLKSVFAGFTAREGNVCRLLGSDSEFHNAQAHHILADWPQVDASSIDVAMAPLLLEGVKTPSTVQKLIA